MGINSAFSSKRKFSSTKQPISDYQITGVNASKMRLYHGLDTNSIAVENNGLSFLSTYIYSFILTTYIGIARWGAMIPLGGSEW